jgi:hypothetical protein
MAITTGTIENFSGSMAAAIESAFLGNWTDAMPNQPQPTPTDQMRLLYVAIAQGVMNYLAANPDAFTLTTSTPDGINFTTTLTGITLTPES